MSKIDDKLNNLLSKDKLPFEASNAIQQQLNYHLQLKTASSKVKQNSVIPFLGGLLTTKLLGLKISVITVLLCTLIGYNQMNKPSSSFPLADTISISKSIDSIGSYSVDDSLMVY